MSLPVICPAESFTIEQVLSAPFPYGLTSAPRAPRVAWVFDNKGERNIWVADAPVFVARQTALVAGREAHRVSLEAEGPLIHRRARSGDEEDHLSRADHES